MHMTESNRKRNTAMPAPPACPPGLVLPVHRKYRILDGPEPEIPHLSAAEEKHE